MTAPKFPPGVPPGVPDPRPLPRVGALITEGMGTYRVLAHAGGTRLRVESHVGTRIEIDFADSGYRDPRNAWREVH